MLPNRQRCSSPMQNCRLPGSCGQDRSVVLTVILLTYLVFGCVMDSLSMILLTVPIFFPLVVSLGVDPIWFGVLIVVVVEIGLISPPVGMNLFVLNALLKDVSLKQIFRGVWLFVAMLVLALVLCLEFQWLSLWLPSFMP